MARPASGGAVSSLSFALVDWRERIPKDFDSLPLDQQVTQKLQILTEQTNEVLKICDQLESLHNKLKQRTPSSENAVSDGGGTPAKLENSPDTSQNGIDDNWNLQMLRQLEWGIKNAIGDVRVNCAFALENTLYWPDHKAKQREWIELAAEAFHRCESLLPAGVETLSNLGATYLVKGDYPLARDYFSQVIKLNPAYEYAYYRLAQSWERELWREKVTEVLKTFPRPPTIPSFAAMYSKYHVEPKHEYPQELEVAKT